VTAEGLDALGALTDEEPTALALAADPDAPRPEGAVPIGMHLAQFGTSLPLWYMPPAAGRVGRRWKAPCVIAVVSAFPLIDVMGLCNAYGVIGLWGHSIVHPAQRRIPAERGLNEDRVRVFRPPPNS